jgi:integration host factor subunit beta
MFFLAFLNNISIIDTKLLSAVIYPIRWRRRPEVMNKSQLIEALAKMQGLTIKNAEFVVTNFFDSIEVALVRRERVEIRGFGSFKVKNYLGYQGRNPKTGSVINVHQKKLPFFKVGKELKEMVDIL